MRLAKLEGPSSLPVSVIDSGFTLISLSATVRSFPETIVVQKEFNADKSRVRSDIATPRLEAPSQANE
jgi:hypothetical protein